MKTQTFFLLAMLALSAGMSCLENGTLERKVEDPPAQDTVKQDTAENTVEKWVSVFGQIKIEWDLYPLENKFYSVVTKPSDSKLQNLPPHNEWIHYKMEGDTMCWSNSPGGGVYKKWLLRQPERDVFSIHYLGSAPANALFITDFLFNREY
jgi:hypothetical protein